MLKQFLVGKGYYKVSLSVNGKTKQHYVHRLMAISFLSGSIQGKQVDHKNGIKTDNNIENLRIVTRQQNCFNSRKMKGVSTSVFKGVYWSSQKQKWHAEIKVNNKKKHLGFFDVEIEAAMAYNEAAKILMGEYCCCNVVATAPL